MTDTMSPGMSDPLDDELDELMSAMEDCTGVLAKTSTSSHFSSCIPVATAGDFPEELVDGFDRNAGRTWIYPTNKEVRDYQYNIVQKALFQNTLVCLPTGLGKTFIAAVVMFNFYRWYPRGMVIFMAPTKPLVTQQMEACYEVMGIPQAHMSEMTGSTAPHLRQVNWKEKRVFFLTPQVISNDLNREYCPANRICCVVIDEAHKALGNHAYVQVIREMMKNSKGNFRVLALSATPGSNYMQVRQVVKNLLIANVEIRNDDSIDIKPYTHSRLVEKVVVTLSAELLEAKTSYETIVGNYVERLHRYGVLARRNLDQLSKYFVLKERDRFRQSPPAVLSRLQFGAVECDFALVISLFHALDLLLYYGLLSFYVYWQEVCHGDKGNPRTRYELRRNVAFCSLMGNLERRFGSIKSSTEDSSTSAAPQPKYEGYSHPKFVKLEEIVLKHFAAADSSEDEDRQQTRIIVFTQYRESVREIEAVLNRHRPQVRPVVLIGHGQGATARAAGLRQKEQMHVMTKFRTGECNVLVSTCIGEEGLDIGDVDLIVCFDAQKSPIRLVQRMGRTGRKRDGKVIVLLTKGKEEYSHNQGQCNSKAVKRSLSSASGLYDLYRNSPRMIPADLEPVCHKMYLSCEAFVRGKAKKKVTPETAAKPQRKRRTKLPYDDAFVPDANQSLLTSYVKVSDKKKMADNAKSDRRTERSRPIVRSSDFDDHGDGDDDFCMEASPPKRNSSPDLPAIRSQPAHKSDVVAVDDALLDFGPGNDFFLVHRKPNVNVYDEMDHASKNVSGEVTFVVVKSPPPKSGFDMLDAIDVDFLTSVADDEKSSSTKRKFQEDSHFKTPKSVSFSNDVDSSKKGAGSKSSCKPKSDSLYSLSQLMGMIHQELMDPDSHGTCVHEEQSVQQKDGFSNAAKENFASSWDPDDDWIAGLQMVTSSPEKSWKDMSSCRTAKDDFDITDVIPPSPKITSSALSGLFSRNTQSLVSCRPTTCTLQPVVLDTAIACSNGQSREVGHDDESLSLPSSDDSVIVRRVHRRRPALDEFESSSEETQPAKYQRPRPLSKGFLDDEARLDDDVIVVSSDESSDGLDFFDASFIDDDVNQDHGCNETMYLKSVKSPRCRPGAFKLVSGSSRVRKQNWVDVFSQSVSSEESEYAKDSFCISNTDESGEPTCTPPPRQKRRHVVMADHDVTSEEEID